MNFAICDSSEIVSEMLFDLPQVTQLINLIKSRFQLKFYIFLLCLMISANPG